MPFAHDLDRAGLKNATIQALTGSNEVLIRLDIRETSEQALDQGKEDIIKALQTNAEPGKTDLNNIGYYLAAGLPAQGRPAPPRHRRARPSTARSPAPSWTSATRPAAAS